MGLFELITRVFTGNSEPPGGVRVEVVYGFDRNAFEALTEGERNAVVDRAKALAALSGGECSGYSPSMILTGESGKDIPHGAEHFMVALAAGITGELQGKGHISKRTVIEGDTFPGLGSDDTGRETGLICLQTTDPDVPVVVLGVALEEGAVIFDRAISDEENFKDLQVLL